VLDARGAPTASRDEGLRIEIRRLGECRLAVNASGVEDASALAALHEVELKQPDEATAAQPGTHRSQAARPGTARCSDKSRAVSALAFALSNEPDEAIHEGAYAVGTPAGLISALGS